MAARDSQTVITHAVEIANEADRRSVPLRITGGAAIAYLCPSALQPPLARTYADVDFIARKGDTAPLEQLLKGLGYEPDEQFNALHGEHRLWFESLSDGSHIDVFIDALHMCHVLPLGDRLISHGTTLPPADLLLSKLQVVETNEKDFQDAIALLVDCEITDDESGISRTRVTEICCSDWGWWRTVTEVAAKVRDRIPELAPTSEQAQLATSRLDGLLADIEAAPKSRRWKLRSRVGEKVRWYEMPEEAV